MYQNNNNNSQTTVLFHLQHVHQHASLWRLDIKDFYRAARRAKIDKCAQHNSPRYHAALDFYQKLNFSKNYSILSKLTFRVFFLCSLSVHLE